MQIDLHSGNQEIIASGEVFLFGQSNGLVIRVTDGDDFEVCVTLKFLTDSSRSQRIDREIDSTGLVLHCYNFAGEGTGLSHPALIATANEKRIFLMFWMYEQGANSPKARSVKYTLFREP